MRKDKELKQAGSSDKLLADLRKLILETCQVVGRSVNSVLVLLYWKVGQRIRGKFLPRLNGPEDIFGRTF
jgi:hypothetical protein